MNIHDLICCFDDAVDSLPALNVLATVHNSQSTDEHDRYLTPFVYLSYIVLKLIYCLCLRSCLPDVPRLSKAISSSLVVLYW